MFWKVAISNRAPDLLELCRALSDFFEYAAGQRGRALDEGLFQRSRPGIADWLLQEFRGRQKNKQGLQRAVAELFRLPAARRRAVADAVAHDMEFWQAGDGAGFYLQTAALPEGERALLHDFFLYFNDVVLARKRGPRLNGRDCPATRAELSLDYYQINPVLNQICPVCLSQRRNAVRENELDHYFPKSVYPVLAVHPWNLMYICKECNQTYKKDRDCLSDGSRALESVYRPYRDTVREHAALEFHWKPGEEHEWVRLRPAVGRGGEMEKISNFDALFQLEERWSIDAERIYEELRLCYAGQGRVEGEDDPRRKEELRGRLADRARELKRLADPGFPEKFLESEYTAWLCGEQLDAFFAALD